MIPFVFRAFVSVVLLCYVQKGLVSAQNNESNEQSAASESRPSNPAIELAAELVTLKHPELGESSGLGFSRRRPDYLWTHNDSGNEPEIFAFNLKGKLTASVDFSDDVKSRDWEDMACFTYDDQPMILVADCGDNWARRKNIKFYIFAEPDPAKDSTVKNVTSITVRYGDHSSSGGPPGGPRDCEAVAVCEATNEIWLISKSVLPHCTLWKIPLPPLPGKKSYEMEADYVATMNIPLVTGADIDRNSRALWLGGYFYAFKIPLGDDPNDLENFANVPSPITIPPLRQVEALALDEHGNPWITSEGTPAKLAPVNVR
ncbi:MAG: hypothetical protein AAF664_11255 [Planctomycetota bacterium]